MAVLGLKSLPASKANCQSIWVEVALKLVVVGIVAAARHSFGSEIGCRVRRFLQKIIPPRVMSFVSRLIEIHLGGLNLKLS